MRPWDDVPGKRAFVARFRTGGANHVVHVDDEATVGYLIETLDEIVPTTVVGVGTDACGLVDRSTTLRERSPNEKTARTRWKT